ncbi:TadE family protein [Microbacterium testaceum]|uniref:TadE family protein n=1 Tax=Microbacterium testaceum TaxID=2033 RepID=A0A2T7WPE1_MICTE|nr:TadE family protein [Microbacterium testaceum]
MNRVFDERGAVTAEFAVALPAVIVVLALGIGAVGAAATNVRLQHAANESARLLGRDDPDALAAVAEAGGTAAVDRRDGLVCVTATASARGALPLPPLSARACALDGGR